MSKNELRMSRKVDDQPPGSTLQACRHRGICLVVFVHAPDTHHCPHVHIVQGGVVLPVARHLEAPDFVQNVMESLAEELDLHPPRRLLFRPFQLHGQAGSHSQ